MVPFPAPAAGPVVVVGAGTAGSVVARRLVDAGYEVRLVEAGPSDLPGGDARLSATDHLAAHAVGNRWWPDVRARRAATTVDYLLGRGVGGSSAVNGLMAEWDPADPTLAPLQDARRARSEVLVHTEQVTPAEVGPLGSSLLQTPGSRRVTLARRDGRRSDAATAYLEPLLTSGSAALHLDGGTLVDRIDAGPDPAVITDVGDRVEGAAVVLAAGAVHTPAILLRSGLTAGVGEHLQDHPSVVLHLTLQPGVAGSGLPPTGSLAEHDGVQLLPMEYLGDGSNDAALLVALMEPTGANGSVSLASNDPGASPVVDFRLDESPPDLALLGAGVRRALDLLAGPSFESVVASVAIDASGTPASVLDDSEVLERWLRSAPGPYFHASGSCGIGRALDASGRLLGHSSLYVADASAFTRIPRTGTHLPTLVQAERLVAEWIASGDPNR